MSTHKDQVVQDLESRARWVRTTQHLVMEMSDDLADLISWASHNTIYLNPYVSGPDYSTRVMTDAELAGVVKMMKRYGTVEKKWSDDFLTLRVVTPVRVKIEMVIPRKAVCTKVKVRTETVQVPDVDSAPTKTVTQDVYEWQCSPLLERA